MIEILPNWHPIFVHFAVALYTTAVGFYTLSYLTNKLSVSFKFASDFEVVGRWCMWVAGFFAIVTLFAGFYAFNTVKHDASSHLAMIVHRNWAIVTVCGIILVTLRSLWHTHRNIKINFVFIIALYIVLGLLLCTAWHGAELVFRHGLGVMSLPSSEREEGHNHQAGTQDNGHTEHSNMPSSEMLH